MGKPKKRLTGIITLFLILALPAAAAAISDVQKLKDPVTHPREQNQRMESVLDRGDTAIDELIALLNEKPSLVDGAADQRLWAAKVTAMNILSELKAQKAIGLLQGLLENSDDPSAISNAARAIGNIGGQNAFAALKQVLQNAQKNLYSLNEERKRAVLLGLGLCDDKRAIPLLTDELDNPGNDLRTQIYAAGSLGLLGVKDGLDVATSGLDSNDPYVYIAALRALGLIGSSSSVSALTRQTDPNVPYVYRKTAGLSLMQIKTAQLTGNAQVEYLFSQILGHPRTTEYIQWGTHKLKKINTPGAQKALQRLSEQEDGEFEIVKQAAKMRLKTR